MTAYQANFMAYIPRPGTRSLVDAIELYIPGLVIIDGARIGEHDNFAVEMYRAGTSGREADLTSMGQYYTCSTKVLHSVNRNNSKAMDDGGVDCRCPDGSCSFNSTTYEQNITRAGPNTMLWNNETFHLDHSLQLLSQPRSSIMSNYFMMDKNRKLVNGDYPLTMHFALGDLAMDIEWGKKNGVCQTLNTYQWDFSTFFLFIFGLSTTLFTTTLAFLYWDIYRHSRIYRLGSDPCVYHDILALAEELNHNLTGTPEHWSDMTGDELKALMRDVRVDVDAGGLPLSRSEERHMRKRRIKEKKELSKQRYWAPVFG